MTRTVLVVGDVIDTIEVHPLTHAPRGGAMPASVDVSAGGSGLLQALWLAEAGARTRLVGRVAADDHQRHTDALRAAGVDARLAADPSASTGRIVRIAARSGTTIYQDRGANAAIVDNDLPTSVLDDVSLVHVCGDSLVEPAVRRVVVGLVRHARSIGAAVSFDPRSLAAIEGVGAQRMLADLGALTILLPDLDEGRLLTSRDAPAAVAEELTRHAEIVALKLGARGVLIATRGAPPRHVEAHPGDVVDTGGAGDAFAGTFLRAWLEGVGAFEAARAAVRAAAWAIGIHGARPDG